MVHQIISIWGAREYVTGTRLLKEKGTSPGTQGEPRDVPHVQHTLSGKDCGVRVADTC